VKCIILGRSAVMVKEKLPSYHLTRDKKRGGWQLERAGSDRATARFEKKADALKRGVLRSAVGKDGGSVKIHKQNGRIQQERTYPAGRDPTSSKG
jgi:hypothetical protein